MNIRYHRAALTHGPIVVDRKRSWYAAVQIALSGALAAKDPGEFLRSKGVRVVVERPPNLPIDARTVRLEPEASLTNQEYGELLATMGLEAMRLGGVPDRFVVKTPLSCQKALGDSVVMEKRSDAGYHFNLPDRPEAMSRLAKWLELPSLLDRLDFSFVVARQPDGEIRLDQDELLAPLQIDMKWPLMPARVPGKDGKVSWNAFFHPNASSLADLRSPRAPIQIELGLERGLELQLITKTINPRGRYSYFSGTGTEAETAVNLALFMRRESDLSRRGPSAWLHPDFCAAFAEFTYPEWRSEYERRFPGTPPA